jgi:tetratricopeptide (TPR) repeat protein
LKDLMTKHDDVLLLLGRASILLGLSLLALEFVHPLVASVVYNNVGSIRLNRALLAPGLEAEGKVDCAVRAGRSFESALAWDPLNGQAYYNLAAVYDLWQDGPSAARALSRAAVLSPADVCARFRFGQVLAAQGQERRAIQEWRAAGAADFFVGRGQALAGEGDLIGAIVQYERVLDIEPGMAEAYYHIGRALSALGQKEEAIAAFEWAVAHEPPMSPQRYLLQAEIHAARGEWTAALAALGQAAEFSPGDPAPIYRQGELLWDELGDEEAAAARFQQALEIDPYHAASRLALGQLYGERGECEEAARWLAPLLSSDGAARFGSGQAGSAHTLLAACLLARGRADEAISHLEQAVALNPGSVGYLLRLAEGYREAGRYGDAIGAYRRVLELSPENAQARRALEELGWLEP